MFTSPYSFILTDDERDELESMIRSRTLAAGLVQRARVVLAIADGEPYSVIGSRLELSTTSITRWRKRFEERRLPGLFDEARSGRGDRISAALEGKILALTQQPPPKPFTHWTTRRMGKRLSISHMTVQRVWQRAGLKPHILERYVASNDPDFERKAADVIGLYMTPPENALVLCIDEKTAIQALDRREPVLPLSPGRAERHGFEYVRHGMLSLYAALDVGSGHVEGMTALRHTSQEFIAFLDKVVSTQPKGREIHLILDNFSAHKTKTVNSWLDSHPSVKMHFTPTYSSWLNQVELWFAKIERDMIARGIFTSTTDLRRKLMHYIRAHNKNCHPFRWSYSDPSRRIRVAAKSVTVH